MAHLDPIFAQDPAMGFQDIWFGGLDASAVARVFDYACQTYGKRPPYAHACWVQPTDKELGIWFADSSLRNVGHEFMPLIVGDTVLNGVAIRIEYDRLAIDFEGGLEYWNSERQAAFVCWLRDLYRQAPCARLEWTHEGYVDSPSERESMLLRLAVMGYSEPD